MSFMTRSFSMVSLTVLLTGLGACGPEESQEACPDGQSAEVAGVTYCVYTQAVTETGFECPAAYPNRSQSASYTVCASERDVPMKTLDEVEVVVAEVRGEEPKVLAPTVNPDPNVQPTPLLSITAPVTVATGVTPPADGFYDVYTFWSVSSGSPDYLYTFGAGEAEINASGSTFSLSFLTPPPAEALNAYGVGVGLIMGLFDPNKALTQGKYMGDPDVDAGLVSKAAADRYAIIYVAPGVNHSALGWSVNFPEGYSCGRGIAAPAGQGFDSFEPVPCAQVEFRLDTLFDFVNWT